MEAASPSAGRRPSCAAASAPSARAIPIAAKDVRWVKEPLGFGLDYSLGTAFEDFLAGPWVGGRPTHLVWLLHAALAGVGLFLLARAAYRFGRDRLMPRGSAAGRTSPTAFTLGAAFWGFGILLTASSLYVQRHYLVVAFPLGFVWLARLALNGGRGRPTVWKPGRVLLGFLCVAQLLLTASFLRYVHQNGGSRGGDYGVSYRAGQGLGLSPAQACSPGTVEGP